MLAYNVAHKFRITVPKQTFLPSSSDLADEFKQGVHGICTRGHHDDAAPASMLLAQIKESHNIAQRDGIILMEKVRGSTFQQVIKEKTKYSPATKQSWTFFGRLFVFDAAIMNCDRLKVELGKGTASNFGNLMIVKQSDDSSKCNGKEFVAIDNAFASMLTSSEDETVRLSYVNNGTIVL